MISAGLTQDQSPRRCRHPTQVLAVDPALVLEVPRCPDAQHGGPAVSDLSERGGFLSPRTEHHARPVQAIDVLLQCVVGLFLRDARTDHTEK